MLASLCHFVLSPLPAGAVAFFRSAMKAGPNIPNSWHSGAVEYRTDIARRSSFVPPQAKPAESAKNKFPLAPHPVLAQPVPKIPYLRSLPW